MLAPRLGGYAPGHDAGVHGEAPGCEPREAPESGCLLDDLRVAKDRREAPGQDPDQQSDPERDPHEAPLAERDRVPEEQDEQADREPYERAARLT